MVMVWVMVRVWAIVRVKVIWLVCGYGDSR